MLFSHPIIRWLLSLRDNMIGKIQCLICLGLLGSRRHPSRAADIDAHPLHWFAKISSSQKYSQVHVVSRINACQQQKYPLVVNNSATSDSTLTKVSTTTRQASRSNHRIRWHARVIVTWMAFGQIVGVVITWWQVIGMIWWESRPDDVG